MQTKCCTKCGEEKSLDGFHKDKGKKDGLSPHCKICKCALTKKWFKDNPERAKETNRQWNKRNPGASSLRATNWNKSNPKRRKEIRQKWERENPETAKESRRRYERDNAGKMNAKTRKRQAAQLNRTPDWLNKAHHVEMESMYMYNQIMPGDWHVDHIDPLQGETVSGLHVPWNLQVITAKENLAKSNLLLDEAA